MAPKSTNMGEEQFLAACFKFCVDKPKVDFNKLAHAVGMSSGGAANKFRAILKKFEDEGDAPWLNNAASTGDSPDTNGASTPSKRKATPRKPTKKTTKKVAQDDEEDDEGTLDSGDNEDGMEDETPVKKKAKTRAKKVINGGTKAKNKKPVESVSEQDDDIDELSMDMAEHDSAELPAEDGEDS